MKLRLTFLICVFFILSCQKDSDPPRVLKIGDSYGGGIIFYLDSTGKHGLIAAENDQASAAAWGCNDISIPGAVNGNIGAGEDNTSAIISKCTTAHIAAKECSSLILHSHEDWFLPSKEELALLFALKDTVGGFMPEYYWSSTQALPPNDVGYAVQQHFGNGDVGNDGKANLYRVRAIRTF